MSEWIRGILWSVRTLYRSQVVYETNTDFQASQLAISNNPLTASSVTQKQLLWFKFKDSNTVFLLSPGGKLQVKWNSIDEKKTLFSLIKNLLVPMDGQLLKITPKMQQPWIEYPPPEPFRLYWCDEVTEYSQKGSPVAGSMRAREKQKLLAMALDALAGPHEPSVYFRRLDEKEK